MTGDVNMPGNNGGAGGSGGTPRPGDESELLKRMRAIASDLWRETPGAGPEPTAKAEQTPKAAVKRSEADMGNLWMTADETIDWTDALGYDAPPDGLTSQRLWSFYRSQAEAVLAGDTEAYAEVLRKANPLGDLSTFAQGIQISVPDSERVEASFTCREDMLEEHGKKYLCAMGVRIARDLLACLPVSEVGVNALTGGRNVMDASYSREQMTHRNFRFLDPVKLTEECGAVFGLE